MPRNLKVHNYVELNVAIIFNQHDNIFQSLHTNIV